MDLEEDVADGEGGDRQVIGQEPPWWKGTDRHCLDWGAGGSDGLLELAETKRLREHFDDEEAPMSAPERSTVARLVPALQRCPRARLSGGAFGRVTQWRRTTLEAQAQPRSRAPRREPGRSRRAQQQGAATRASQAHG